MNKNFIDEYENTRNPNSKFLIIISKFISIILLLLYFTSVIFFKKTDILPVKYLVLITAILAIISGIFFILQWFKHIAKKTRIILDIISVLLIAALSVADVYCMQLDNFLNNITVSDYEIQNYSVLVLKNDKYTKLSDLNDKSIGYLTNDKENLESIKNEISSSAACTYTEYENISTLKDALIASKVDAIVIEDSYKSILEEEMSDIYDKFKIIHNFSLKYSVESISKEAQVTSEPFNIYISGIDTYGDIGTVSRSDVNIIVTVNPNTKQILLTNIPRDSYVKLHGISGKKDKLTHAGIYGIDMSVKTIEDLLGIDINYYIKVNFSSLESIVDTLGGITAYSKYSFTSYIGNYKFYSGYNNMNGAQALAFSRERKAFSEGDIMRGQNQQAVIEAILRKASTPSIITKYSSLLNALSGKFQTNMSNDKITELIKSQISSGTSWTVTSITLDGTGSNEYTYSYSGGKLSVVLLNESTVTNAKSYINKVLNGEKLSGSYVEITDVKNPTQIKTTTNTNTNNNTTKNNNTTNEEKTNNNTNNNNETTNNTNNNTGNETNNNNDNDNSGEVVIYGN